MTGGERVCHCAICSRYQNNFGICVYCGSAFGDLTVSQRDVNAGLLGLICGQVNAGLAGLAIARLPICSTCRRDRLRELSRQLAQLLAATPA